MSNTMANNDGGQNSNTISSAPHKDVSPFRGGGALNEPKSNFNLF